MSLKIRKKSVSEHLEKDLSLEKRNYLSWDDSHSKGQEMADKASHFCSLTSHYLSAFEH